MWQKRVFYIITQMRTPRYQYGFLIIYILGVVLCRHKESGSWFLYKEGTRPSWTLSWGMNWKHIWYFTKNILNDINTDEPNHSTFIIEPLNFDNFLYVRWKEIKVFSLKLLREHIGMHHHYCTHQIAHIMVSRYKCHISSFLVGVIFHKRIIKASKPPWK